MMAELFEFGGSLRRGTDEHLKILLESLVVGLNETEDLGEKLYEAIKDLNDRLTAVEKILNDSRPDPR